MTDKSDASRVLLVDDDLVFTERAREALEPFTSLRVVRTGNAALRTVPLWKPNVILFDLLMDDIDGFAFLEVIARSIAGRPPFILCTTDGRGADTRVRPLPDWHVGTLVRSAPIHQVRAAVLQAARCQDPMAQRQITA